MGVTRAFWRNMREFIFSKKLLDQDIVIIRPIPLSAQLPSVDKITDDVKTLAFEVAKKFQQLAYLRMPAAQMDV